MGRSYRTTFCSELTSVESFTTRFAAGSDPNRDGEVVVQGLDLQTPDLTELILAQSWETVTFLGCRLSDEEEHHVLATGATVFPPFEDIPFNPYRGALYTTAELAERDLDGRIYRHQAQFGRTEHKPILEALAERIHDHAIDHALSEYLSTRDKVVAIMGGHSLHRDEEPYRQVAVVARTLTRSGHHVVTGGGPGAMEAGNLGSWLAPHPDEALDDAIEILRTAVDYSTPEYIEAGLAVTGTFGDGAESLAIPTWFYGHEPTNAFATAVAKYFSNSIREDGLLAIATHGVVYTPGAAGTVQEVFMDATQNHYTTFEVISPMVFLNSAYWADDRLAAPLLLRQLAGDRPYSEMIAVLDDPDEIVAFIETHPPRVP